MSAPMDISGSGKENEVKPDALDQFILGMARKPLHAIHPRRANRTVTLWKGAVTVKTDDTLPTVFRLMNEENILGCPVTTSSGRFYAFVDIKDLVTFTVGMFAKDEKAISQEAIGTFFQKEEKFKTTTVKDLLDALHPNTNWKELRNELSIPRDMSLLSAYESVVRRGVKRLAVLGDNNQIHSVCTESMLVGWCYNNIDTSLKVIRDVKIGSIAKERMIHSVREDEPVITGFRKMLQANVSGVAVLDKNGDLSDVLSLRDLRGITPTAEDLIRLWRPVSQYKFEIRSKFPKQSPIFPDMYLTMEDTLKTAIVTFDEERVHRLFVVKSTMDKKVVGVFSQSDALRYVLHTAAGPLWAEEEAGGAGGAAASSGGGIAPMNVDAGINTATQQPSQQATAQPMAPEMASAGGAVPITRS